MKKTFNITTFGCQMNEHDSEVIAGMLQEKGFSQVDDKNDAMVAIINTCSVRENADKRFFGTLGQLKKQKEKNKNFIVCVCGCMMQQQHIVDTVKSKYQWVDIVFGTHNISNFPELLDKVLLENEKMVDVIEDTDLIVEGLPTKRLHKHKALVNIMFGCNNFCTYCIVPYTRGREKSRQLEDIVTEIKGLVQDGVKEVMLLGQNVNSYNDGKHTFAMLLREINKIEGLKRIRFMTSHPKDLSDELIECFVDLDKLCKNLHLPVQSGSNRVLKKMNRKYTKEHYLGLISKLKAKVPNLSLSTDIIVGFPSETDEDFRETLELVKEVGYDSSFTFLYSIRKGTPAEKFSEQVPEDIKHERFNELVEEVNKSSAIKNKAYENSIQEVLVDGISKTNPEFLTGRTDSFKLVNFKGDEHLIGELVKVKITKAKTFSLEAVLVD